MRFDYEAKHIYTPGFLAQKKMPQHHSTARIETARQISRCAITQIFLYLRALKNIETVFTSKARFYVELLLDKIADQKSRATVP